MKCRKKLELFTPVLSSFNFANKRWNLIITPSSYILSLIWHYFTFSDTIIRVINKFFYGNKSYLSPQRSKLNPQQDLLKILLCFATKFLIIWFYTHPVHFWMNFIPSIHLISISEHRPGLIRSSQGLLNFSLFAQFQSKWAQIHIFHIFGSSIKKYFMTLIYAMQKHRAESVRTFQHFH